MAKIDRLNEYILKCSEIIQSKDIKAASDLQDKIISVYEAEIPTIFNRLDNYHHYGASSPVDFIGDMIIIEAILENYKDNIEKDERKAERELEKLRLQQSILTINNNNQNSSLSNSSATTTLTVSIDQTIENILKIPDEVLTPAEKEELEEKLSALEVAKNSKDKGKISSKIGSVLKYIADKGIEVGIATLPYLGEISKFIQTL